MKKHIITLIGAVILFVIAFGSTIYGVYRMISMDNSVMSTRTSTKCSTNGDGEITCEVIYTFLYDDSEHFCIKYEHPMLPKEYRDNKMVYFSSKDPYTCSVQYKSNYIFYMILIDIVLGFIIYFEIKYIKNNK